MFYQSGTDPPPARLAASIRPLGAALVAYFYDLRRPRPVEARRRLIAALTAQRDRRRGQVSAAIDPDEKERLRACLLSDEFCLGLATDPEGRGNPGLFRRVESL